MTSIAFVRAGSGNSATGCRRQSEFEPSAWRVELPSKFQTGRSSTVGSSPSSTIFVLLRRFGTGSYPSSQMYSSLTFPIARLLLVRVPERKKGPALRRVRGPNASAGTVVGAERGRNLAVRADVPQG